MLYRWLVSPQKIRSRVARTIFQAAYDAMMHHEQVVKETLGVTGTIIDDYARKQADAEKKLAATLRLTKELRTAVIGVVPLDRDDKEPSADNDKEYRTWLQRQAVRQCIHNLSQIERDQQTNGDQQ
jgi:hypothetical protein